MKYHKLLNRQLSKYLPGDGEGDNDLDKLLSVVSDTYYAQEKDKEFIEHAFGIAEEEYIELNKKLNHEVSEEQFQTLAENIPGILYRYEFKQNGEEGFSYISPDCEKKIGLTEDQLKDFYNVLHTDDRQREKTISEVSRKNNTHYRFEGRFVIPNKPLIWLNLSSSFSQIESDGTKVHTGIILNVTKENEAEQALRIREEKYRNIIANMNLGLLEVDNESIIRYANQSFCDMCGYAMDDLIGFSASDLFVQQKDLQLMEKRAAIRKKGLSDAYEVMVKNKSGENRWWLISGAPRYNDEAEIVGSIGIHLDITEQKNLQHELQQAKKSAESSSNAKQSFLANMSHEIRTPMNAILGMTNQLGKSDLNSNQRFYLDIIHAAADNLLIIVNDILDFSKLEAGKMILENIGFKPSQLIEQAIRVMNYKAEEKGLSLTNSISDPLMSEILIGDPYRLTQILLNLFSNAIKFTEKGGIDITCSVVSDEDEQQLLSFRVRDTGIGMDETFLENLFQKFSQEDESVTRKFGGTGLGMSICKELAECMGGNILAESTKGAGTTITIQIPFKKGIESDLPVKNLATVNTHILAGKKILVTDDNEMNRLVATTILKEFGAFPEEAANGREAVEKIRTGCFDAVLMDVQMPVMDGIEATRVIRQEISKTLPVIALTALALKGDENKFREAGMTDYLSKPFEENQLLQVLGKCFGEINSIAELPEVTIVSESKICKEKLFSLDKLNEISRGNTVFIDKMVMLFIDQAPQSVKEITDAFLACDYRQMSQVAHRFKTSLFNMGIVSLIEDIGLIETFNGTEIVPGSLKDRIVNIETVILQVVDELIKMQKNKIFCAV